MDNEWGWVEHGIKRMTTQMTEYERRCASRCLVVAYLGLGFLLCGLVLLHWELIGEFIW